MKELELKLKDLENAKDCVESCQKELREEMLILDKEKYLEKELIYNNNKLKLQEINNKIEIINNAMNILEGVGI